MDQSGTWACHWGSWFIFQILVGPGWSRSTCNCFDTHMPLVSAFWAFDTAQQIRVNSGQQYLQIWFEMEI